MSPPLRPVYLVLPSSGWEHGARDASVVISGFADTVAMCPATAEAMLLGVVEYADFSHELAPIGTSAETLAAIKLSGFDGLSFANLFTGLTELLDYDRYRLEESGVRAGRPAIVLVLNTAPARDDGWQRAHALLTREPGRSVSAPPAISVVAVTAEAHCAAGDFTFPARSGLLASPASAGRLAADAVLGRLRSGSAGGAVN